MSQCIIKLAKRLFIRLAFAQTTVSGQAVTFRTLRFAEEESNWG